MKDENALAVWFTGKKGVELRGEIVSPSPGQALVRSRLIGISHGTEMLFYRGDIDEGVALDASLPSLNGVVRYPVKYGYINVGTTEGKKVFAFYPHQTAFCIGREEAVFLPEHLSFDDAVFLAHMETAVSIVQDAHPTAGDVILVLGQGTVGLLVAEILKRTHAGSVITVDGCEKRRTASEAVGCIAIDANDPDADGKISDITEGRGPDCAINVSGSQTALQQAIDTVCFEGRIIEASWYGSRRVTIDLGMNFHRKRVTLQSSQVSSIGTRLSRRWNKKRRLDLVISLLETISPSKYITHRVPLPQVEKAYELIANHPEDTIQVVLLPEG